MVEEGDVVRIDYVGRIGNTGEIFDLTSEELAEEEGYDAEEMELGPMNVLIGADYVIEGLDETLRDMDEGDKKEVTVPSEKAFGERDSDSVRTIKKSDFDEHDVPPRRGLVVEIDGRRGKILSTSSGRVRIDFNHPLAGKDLEYEVEVLEVFDNVDDRIDAVLEFYGLDEMDIDTDFADGDLTITLPADVNNPEFADQLEDELQHVKGVESVSIEMQDGSESAEGDAADNE